MVSQSRPPMVNQGSQEEIIFDELGLEGFVSCLKQSCGILGHNVSFPENHFDMKHRTGSSNWETHLLLQRIDPGDRTAGERIRDYAGT
jgi:hypothetical protein